MEDYYKLLGIKPNATQEQIKINFKRLALIYHPDKTGGEDELFKKINEAYQTLSDHWKRKDYDDAYKMNSFSQNHSKTNNDNSNQKEKKSGYNKEKESAERKGNHNKKEEKPVDNNPSSTKPKFDFQYVIGMTLSALFIFLLYYLLPLMIGNRASQKTNLDNNRSDVVKQQTVCESGYAISKSSGTCISVTEYCKEELGKNSYYKAGNNSCECATGYSYNETINKCSSNTSVCSNKYSGSVWDGTSCVCPKNYTWNDKKTGCMAVVQKTKEQLCEEENGKNAFYNETNDLCECKSGYWLSNMTKTCETANAICVQSYPNSYWDDKMCTCHEGYKMGYDGIRNDCFKIIQQTPVTTINEICKALNNFVGYYSKNNKYFTDSQCGNEIVCLQYKSGGNIYFYQVTEKQNYWDNQCSRKVISGCFISTQYPKYYSNGINYFNDNYCTDKVNL